jgi:hypothetical protein
MAVEKLLMPAPGSETQVVNTNIPEVAMLRIESIEEIDYPSHSAEQVAWEIRPMADFPRFEFSMRDVRRAGDALRGDLIWNDETADSIRDVFKIANNWRDSHAFPMRKLRYELIGQMRRQQVSGQTAARLKRMPSIRRKLRRISANLNQIQDMAGCRAILPSIKDVNAVH